MLSPARGNLTRIRRDLGLTLRRNPNLALTLGLTKPYPLPGGGCAQGLRLAPGQPRLVALYGGLEGGRRTPSDARTCIAGVLRK